MKRKTTTIRRRKPRRNLSPTDRQRMASLFLKGRTFDEIVKEFGCHRRTVWSTLRRLGVLEPSVSQIWTDGERRQMADLYADGYTQTEIARQFGCGEPTVRQSLRQFGVKIRPRGGGRELTPKDHRRMAKMYNDGMTQQDIIKEFQCSKKTVINILRKQGVELRPTGCRFTPKQCRAIATLYKKGVSQDIIAKQFGTDEKTIARTLRRSGIAIRSDGKRHFTSEDHREMVRLYRNGFTQAEIGGMFSCSSTAIFYIMRKLGIKARPARRWKSEF